MFLKHGRGGQKFSCSVMGGGRFFFPCILEGGGGGAFFCIIDFAKPPPPPPAINNERSLNPNKAAGPDRISSRALKEIADELYRPLTSLFQNSLNSRLVPNQWKSALVTPIFKKGDKHNPANYRPVSLTSICCKVLEHIVAKALLCHLESNKILIENQHGFRQTLM